MNNRQMLATVALVLAILSPFIAAIPLLMIAVIILALSLMM